MTEPDPASPAPRADNPAQPGGPRKPLPAALSGSGGMSVVPSGAVTHTLTPCAARSGANSTTSGPSVRQRILTVPAGGGSRDGRGAPGLIGRPPRR